MFGRFNQWGVGAIRFQPIQLVGCVHVRKLLLHGRGGAIQSRRGGGGGGGGGGGAAMGPPPGDAHVHVLIDFLIARCMLSCCNAMYTRVQTCVYVYTCEVTCIVCGQVSAYTVIHFGDDLHYLSSLPHPYLSLSPNMHTAVHMHGDGYMTCMFDLFYSFTPYQDNVTPLHVANQNGHYDVVQTLVRAGADANIARSDVSDMVLCSYSTCTH